jgi:hypothetical protein
VRDVSDTVVMESNTRTINMPATPSSTVNPPNLPASVFEAGQAEKSATPQAQRVKKSVRETWEQTEGYVRQHPRESALAGLGAGVLLAQIPLRYLVAGFFSLLIAILKPVALFYAVTNVLRDSRRKESLPIPSTSEVVSAAGGVKAAANATEGVPSVRR